MTTDLNYDVDAMVRAVSEVIKAQAAPATASAHFDVVPVRIPDPTAIPPREWLYGAHLIRRHVSTLVAPGGAGKTSFSVALALAVATGRPLLRDTVHAAANVLICNLEDPRDELDRRIAAGMIHHGIDAAAIAGRIHAVHGRESPLVMAATLSGAASERGEAMVISPARDQMVAVCREREIGLVIVDPFANSHQVDENDNMQMNDAVRAWVGVADACDAAVLLVHHTRKGATAGDVDAARGASALMAAARVAMTLVTMDAAEAETHAIPASSRRQYIRLDDPKSSMSAGAGTRWMRLHSVPLGNGTAAYPDGDRVQALAAWDPPDVWRLMDNATANRILDAIAEGPAPGARYTAVRTVGGMSRWAGKCVIDALGCNDAQARTVVAQWLQTGVLESGEYRDPTRRGTRVGVIVVDGRRPS